MSFIRPRTIAEHIHQEQGIVAEAKLRLVTLLLMSERYPDAEQMDDGTGRWASKKAYEDCTHVDGDVIAYACAKALDATTSIPYYYTQYVFYLPVQTAYGEVRLYSSMPAHILDAVVTFKNERPHLTLMECLRPTVDLAVDFLKIHQPSF